MHNATVDRPAVTVDVVIWALHEQERQRRLHVLLIKRASEPYIDHWALPGSFVGLQEPLDSAARRILAQEPALRDAYLEQLYTFGQPERDPRTRVISVAYFALIRADQSGATRTNDAMRWFAIDALPQSLAFDHDHILRVAIDRLRSKLQYTTLAFQLLPDVFTLPELKQTYETILGETLDRGNFYRKIKEAGLLEPVGRMRESRGRPAALYRAAQRREGEFVFRWREARLPNEEHHANNG